MRQTIRAAVKRGRRRVAVVCGAWHAPVLDLAAAAGVGRCGHPARPAQDARSPPPGCRGRTSGWPAPAGTAPGSPRPGWYHHLWSAPDRPIVRWLTKVARSPADPGPAGVERARDRGGPAGRDPGQSAGPAAGRADRGHRRDPGGALRRRRDRRSASSPSELVVGQALGSRRPRGADRAAGGRPDRDLPAPAAQARGRGPSCTTSTCASRSTSSGPAVPPAPAARPGLGPAGRERDRRAGARSGRPGSRPGGRSSPLAVVEAAVWGTTVLSRGHRRAEPRPPRAAAWSSSPRRSSAACSPSCPTASTGCWPPWPSGPPWTPTSCT